MAKKLLEDKPKIDSRVVWWLNEIEASKKREKSFRKDGQKIYSIYRGDKPDEIPFNILFSNTETLLPAVYSAVPRPAVARRFKDDSDVGMAAAKASNHMLEFSIDTNYEGYETYNDAMESAVLDALVPGRGVTCVKYDAEVGEISGSVDDSDPDNTESKAYEGEEKAEGEPDEYKESELVCCDSRSWDRVYFGFAKKWSKVPWVAYFEQIDKEEAERLFGAKADKLVFTKQSDDEDERDTTKKTDEMDEGERKTAPVYQIWDKETKTVKYVSPQYKEDYLLEQDDPLQLTGFFNCPKPLQFIAKSNDLLPVAPFKLYENQAKELNRLTVRINKVVEAIKARGVYDGELGQDIANILKGDDNVLVPSESSSTLAYEKGLSNAIWMWPIETLVNVLRELYTARENCKQVIFEIMGLADIMRGASNASETLGAQQIKQTWGSLRLKRLQKEVQRYSRDLLRMMLEVAANKFSEDTWAKMTGLPYLTEMQFQQLQMQAQGLQQQMQQMQMMPPPPGPPGQPPAPNPQLQQVQQQIQQIQQQLQTPQWKDILAVLKDDMQRSYKIDIETNSTVEPEAVEDQKNISDVMTALGQFLNGVTPLIQQGVMPFQAAQAMMLAITRRFRFGDEIEDYIKQMQAPKPQDDGKADAAKQQMQAQQQVAQSNQKAVEANFQATQAQAALKTKSEEVALISRKADLDIREIKVKAEEELLNIRKQNADAELARKSEHENNKLAMKKQVQSIEKNAMDTEGKVGEVAESKLGDGVAAMQQIVQQLAQVVAQSTVENQQNMDKLVAVMSRPRVKKANRGQDGKIESVVEEIG